MMCLYPNQAEVRALERGLDRIKDCIRDIDYRVSRVSQTATRIGDRLQVLLPYRVERCKSKVVLHGGTPLAFMHLHV